MASSSETGHYKNIANFNLLRTACASFGSNYNPSNPILQVPNMVLLYTDAATQHTAVTTALVPYKAAVNARQTVYADMRKRSTRIFYAVKVSANVDSKIVEDVRSILFSIRGERISKAIPESETQISVAQTSFDNLYDHFAKLVALVGAIPTYAPNEVELQIVTITALREALLAANNLVISAAASLNTATMGRNEILYRATDGVVEVALSSKTYVGSAFGKNSDPYRAVKGIKFTRKRA
jgi:hypothetical protein